MVNVNYYGSTDDPTQITRVDIDNTVAADSSDGVTIRVRYYTNSNYSTTIRYSVSADYRQKRENIIKYLQRKKMLQVMSGWENPKEVRSVIGGKSKQPIFKNHAMNSNRGN